MFERLDKIEQQYLEIEKKIASPEVTSDPKKLQALAQERASLENLVNLYRIYKEKTRTLEETKKMLIEELDDDMTAMVIHEIENLESQLESQLYQLKLALLPKDASDDRDIIMEIRAGTGGDEAGLFAADLFRMYSRYAQNRKWGVDIIDANETAIGGIKEIIYEIKGKGAFSRLKYERGVHRVQRVPTTESSGRIHTSTATVAVLPEAKEVEVDINPKDIRIDIFHSGGAGGQNVNKVATAVRITHLPTGIVAVCQDERSQYRNKMKAMAVLRARLLDIEQSKREGEITEQRRSQVGSGERAEKIRTYNYPQDRITDHRVGLSMHNLPKIMEGELDELIDAIATSEQAKKLEAQLV
ncbi:MAG: peptide chain release factor 1 [Dehalococcoidia bacterium]|nr:MAG: peptide chain release factor 1 [Dehalococcoidia bacterium]